MYGREICKVGIIKVVAKMKCKGELTFMEEGGERKSMYY